MATDLRELENLLWQAADNPRANSSLSSFEYSNPVLGLIFLRSAWHRFKPLHKELEGKSSGRRTIGPDDYKAEGVLYLPEEARYNYLLQLPETEDIGQKINEAMEAIEKVNKDVAGDVFGQIYEYFLSNFAMSEGQKGGEFFTPTSIMND